jgi:hypothetical protein
LCSMSIEDGTDRSAPVHRFNFEQFMRCTVFNFEIKS